MTRKALTDRLIRAVKPPASGRLEIFDARLPGFCLRVTARGKKTFALMYRFAGRIRTRLLSNLCRSSWPLRSCR